MKEKIFKYIIKTYEYNETIDSSGIVCALDYVDAAKKLEKYCTAPNKNYRNDNCLIDLHLEEISENNKNGAILPLEELYEAFKAEIEMI